MGFLDRGGILLGAACISAVLGTAPLRAQETREEIARQNELLRQRSMSPPPGVLSAPTVQAPQSFGGGGSSLGGSSLGGASQGGQGFQPPQFQPPQFQQPQFQPPAYQPAYQAPQYQQPQQPQFSQPTQRAAGGPNEVMTDLLERLVRLEEENRLLRGQVERLGNLVQTQGNDTTKQFGDLSYRVEALEKGGAAAQAAGAAVAAKPGQPAAPAAATPAAPAVKRTPELALQEGNAALARRDYAAAEAAANEVIQAAKGGPRGMDGQFLLAQALAGGKNWQKSAVAYYDAYDRGKTGSRAPEALLGLANALVALNDKKSACDTLNKLHAEFPNPRTEVKDGVVQVRMKAGCK